MSRSARLGFTLPETLVSLALIGCMFALLLPAIAAMRETARATHCMQRLTELGKAVISYEVTFGSLPTNTDRPWTVSSSPNFEKATHLQMFQPNAGIDDEPNLTLARTRIPILECPASRQQPVGSGGFAAGDFALSFDVAGQPLKFLDGNSNTALVFENANAGVPWLEGPMIPLNSATVFSTPHRAFPLLVGDGSAHWLRKDVAPEVIEALRTPHEQDFVILEP